MNSLHELDSLLSPAGRRRFSASEIPGFADVLAKRISTGQCAPQTHYVEELEECILHKYDLQTLKETLLSFRTEKKIFSQPYALYRILSDQEKNYQFAIYYHDVTSSEYARVKWPSREELIEEMKRNEENLLFSGKNEDGRTRLVLKSINSSKNTVLVNVVETFHKHGLFPPYCEIWYIKSKDPKIKSLYVVDCLFDAELPEEVTESLRADFERYLHHYIKPLSIFDIVGPPMVGPSSSHTAGANRIGQIARNILAAYIKGENRKLIELKVKLLGSFRDTGPGHRTPSALGGGLWGFATDHPEMLLHGDPDFLQKNGIEMEGMKVRFGGFIRGEELDDDFYKKDLNNNIAEIIAETDKGTLVITGFSIGGGNVEVRYLNREKIGPLTGKDVFFLADGKILPDTDSEGCDNAAAILPVYPVTGRGKKKYLLPFNTFEELQEYVEKSGRSLLEILLETEEKLQGSGEEEIFAQTAAYWKIMKESIQRGMNDPGKSLLKLTGGDSGKVNAFLAHNPLFDNFWGKALTYAVAVNEVNAKSGVIVACPTAGSCGLLPGVLAAYEELRNPSTRRLHEAILVAGFFGMILFNDVTTAGADYGCQAEIGSGAAMAAAAVTYLEGGSLDQVIHSFVLAIKNALGLICDPVAGLVEVPCVKRNGIYSSVAISASLMALSGVRSFISPDEVILVMKEAGEKLNRDFKETAGGGLAKTRDGKAVDRLFASEVKRFFRE